MQRSFLAGLAVSGPHIMPLPIMLLLFFQWTQNPLLKDSPAAAVTLNRLQQCQLAIFALAELEPIGYYQCCRLTLLNMKNWDVVATARCWYWNEYQSVLIPTNTGECQLLTISITLLEDWCFRMKLCDDDHSSSVMTTIVPSSHTCTYIVLICTLSRVLRSS